MEVSVTIGDDEVQTPYQIAQELHQHRLVVAAQRIKEDASVHQFIEAFDAKLVEESIKYPTLKAIS